MFLIATRETVMRSFPRQKRAKPTKGRTLWASPLLLRASSLFWGRDKICTRLDNGFAIACARIKGRELAKKFLEMKAWSHFIFRACASFWHYSQSKWLLALCKNSNHQLALSLKHLLFKRRIDNPGASVLEVFDISIWMKYRIDKDLAYRTPLISPDFSI